MRTIWILLDSRGMGGIETHVAELAAGLAAEGMAAHVVFLADHGPHPLRARLEKDGVPWTCLDGGITDLTRRLRRERPDVLHTHGYKSNLIGRLAGRVTGVPVVATYHAGERPPGALALYDALDRWTSWLGGRIAVSRPILARLPFGGTLVPNFVAVPADPPAVKADTIAFAGRMMPEKGPDQFLNLAAQMPEAHFALYGDGPMRRELEPAASGNVTFMGAVAGMETAWRSIGLLVISSRAEGLPLAALEAMAHGVPVASFALGGLPELIEDGRTGFLAAPGDVSALTECVTRWLALGPEGRGAMARAAWRTVSERFSRTAGVAATRSLYPA